MRLCWVQGRAAPTRTAQPCRLHPRGHRPPVPWGEFGVGFTGERRGGKIRGEGGTGTDTGGREVGGWARERTTEG